MSNLSIRQRNTIDCFLHAPAQNAYLWAMDKGSEDRAYKFGCEVERLCEKLIPAIEAASATRGLEYAPSGLLKFILDRHRHLRFPK